MLIEKFDDSLNTIKDQRLIDLKEGKITGIEFWRTITQNDPYYIRNKTLMTIDSVLIKKEIEDYKKNIMNNPSHLLFNNNIILPNLEKFKIAFPELSSFLDTFERNTKGYHELYKKIVELNKLDKEMNFNRDLSILKNIIHRQFIENWIKEPEIRTPMIMRYINIPTAEELEAENISRSLMNNTNGVQSSSSGCRTCNKSVMFSN